MRRAGIVLAGGRSRRMGSSKAFLEWHGATLLERVASIVARAVGEGPVVVVAAPGQQLPPLPGRFELVTDTRAGLGPLQGIGTGLTTLAGRAELAFVSSTDAALLHPAFVGRVLDGFGDEVDVVLPHARGHRQPLAAGYRVELAPLVDRLLEDGLAKPGFLYERVRTRVVDDAWLLGDPLLARFDPGLASLENLNEPADYEAARALPEPDVDVERDGGPPRRVRAGSIAAVGQALGLAPGSFTAVVDCAVAGPAFPLARGDRVAIDSGGTG